MTFFGVIGSGIPAAAISTGSTAIAMGGLLFGLLVLTALAIVLADRRSLS
jgi:hypothetical protein